MNTITTSNAATCAIGTIAVMSTTVDQIQQWVYIVVIAISAIATIVGLIHTWKTDHTINKSELNKLQDDLKKIEDVTKKDDATKED